MRGQTATPSFGKSSVKVRSRPTQILLPDVSIRWSRLSPRQKITRNPSESATGDTCRLFFCLEGCLHTVGSGKVSGTNLQIISGCCGLAHHSRACRCLCCGARCKTRLVEIQYAQPYLERLMGAGRLKQVLKSGTTGIVTKTTPAMDRILRLLQDRTVPDYTDPLFVMAKALELMWLFVDTLEKTPRVPANPIDRKGVHRAQTILETSLETPPSLSELAAVVGMSASKFKQVFPQVCGLTPYAYLRQARMERAMYLLCSTGMSVTETALEVGYASPSRFSRAFADHFGLTPSHMRRKR